MAAQRKRDTHETGEAKMKAAAMQAVTPVTADSDTTRAIPSPAKELQDRLHAHYQPLSQRMAVILVSLLVAFAFIGGWVGGAGGAGLI